MKYLINTITSWDEPPRARHQVAKALAKKNNVILIARNELGKPGVVVTQLEKNLKLITPYFPIDYRIRYRLPIINEIYQNWLFKKLSIEYKNVRVINFDHTATQIYKYFDNVIYYCNDEYLKYYLTKSLLVLFYHYLTEKVVSKKALFCIGVCGYLKNKLLNSNPNSFLIYLGAPSIDYKRYSGIAVRNNNKYKIHICYVGTFARINVKWIKYLLSHNENWYLTMIGHPSKNIKRQFINYNNISFIGVKKYDELYDYIANMDICIAPYMTGKNINKVVSIPNKFWLYLAFGKPIITCNIPNLKSNNTFVYQSQCAENFINNIELAISENTEKLIRQRIEFARKNTWNNRIEKLLIIYSIYDKS